MDHTDICVVGGGPAGLAAAIAARRKGFRVAVVEAARPPIDKACGEGIMPDGLAALREIGVPVRLEHGAPFRGLRFVDGAYSASALFAGEPGIGLRRTALHELLAEHAAASGVALHWGTPVRGLAPGRVDFGRRTLRCRWIVGADGERSLVRRWAGLDAGRRTSRRVGFRCHFAIEPWSDHVEVYWGERGQWYVTPVGPRELCVAFVTRDPRLRFPAALAACPALTRHLAGAHPLADVRGAVSVSRRLHAVQRGAVALVGDASGSVDAITGEGLCLAFRQALALAAALAADDLSAYQTTHRRIARLPAWMARLMLLLDRHPALRRRIMRALSSDPALFPRLAAIHTGALAPGAFGVGGALSLGWQLLTG